MFYVFEGVGAKFDENVESEAKTPSASPIPKKPKK